jgi:hypothetical protein
MREHALPQDVTNYKFHIIGNMTLKQFAEVAAGFGIAFLLYHTNLPFFLKWPLILFSAGFGALLAFVPFEERPLDQWVIVFFRALYRPTQFYWKRKSKVPAPFLYKPRENSQNNISELDLTPVRRQRVKEYLRSVETPEELDSLETYTNQRLSEVMTVFEQPLSFAQASATAPAFVTTQLAQQPLEPIKTEWQTPDEPIPTIQVIPAPRKTPPKRESLDRVVVLNSLSNLPASATAVPKPSFANPVAETKASTTLPKAEVIIPEQESIKVTPTYATNVEEMNYSQADTVNQADTFINSSALPSMSSNQLQQPLSAVTQNIQLPFPDVPTEPNKIVGMVIDTENNPLVNAIVEILTPEGFPARAVKTNLLGQFFITTPLTAGTYIVRAEKDGLQFSPQELILNDEVVSPLEIRAS